MIASRAPSETISRTAIAWSSASLNSCPTSSSASSTLGEMTSGSARTARRSGSPVGVDDRLHARAGAARGSAGRRRRRRRCAAASPRTRTASPPWRGRAACRRSSSTSCSETDGPRSLISVCWPVVGSITAVLVRDSSWMRTKSESTDTCVSCSTSRVPVAPPAMPGGDHRRAERLEHARDVDALAARHRRLVDAAVAPAEAEVRDRQGLVDRRVERDGEDHGAVSASRRGLRGARGRRRRRRVSSTLPRSATTTRPEEPAAG